MMIIVNNEPNKIIERKCFVSSLLGAVGVNRSTLIHVKQTGH